MKYVLPLAFFLCLFSTGSAQEITVKVSVTGDFGLKEQITSKLNRHFRQFKDVVLVESDYYFVEVEVIAVEVKRAGDTVAYALSVVVLDRISDIDGFLATKECPKGAKDFDIYVGRDLVSEHWLYVVPASKLDVQCQAIVESVDSRTLEPFRKSR